MTFVGLLPPGMINMTVVGHAIQNGQGKARKFAAGAAMIVGIQSLIALTFAEWLLSHPQVVVTLRKAAILVFLALAVHFYRLSKQKVEVKNKASAGRFVIAGMIMSSLNMLAIPFFLGYATAMQINGWLRFEYPHIAFFVAGAGLGAFILFAVYARFAVLISKKIGFIARNINLLLALLFVILTIVSLVTLLGA